MMENFLFSSIVCCICSWNTKDHKCFLDVFVFSKLPESDFPSTHNSKYSPLVVAAGTIEILSYCSEYLKKPNIFLKPSNRKFQYANTKRWCQAGTQCDRLGRTLSIKSWLLLLLRGAVVLQLYINVTKTITNHNITNHNSNKNWP